MLLVPTSMFLGLVAGSGTRMIAASLGDPPRIGYVKSGGYWDGRSGFSVGGSISGEPLEGATCTDIVSISDASIICFLGDVITALSAYSGIMVGDTTYNFTSVNLEDGFTLAYFGSTGIFAVGTYFIELVEA